MRTSRRIAARLAATLLTTLLSLSTPRATPGPRGSAVERVPAAAAEEVKAATDPNKAGSKDEKKEEKKWDVANPPGTWTSIPIDTSETTWSDVDVSPDGKTIVFDLLGDIYTVAAEGGDVKALTEGIPWDTEPRFSPDGKKIAFISDRGGADNLWLMNADGTAPKAVTEEKEHLVHNPSWSADGEYVVAKKDFTSTRSIPAGEIWLFHVGGGGGLVLIERPDGAKAQKNIAEPSLSPDGRWLYYSQDTTPGRVWQYDKDSTGRIFSVRRLDRKTGEVNTIIDAPGGAIRPTPSHDGKLLAFVRRTPDMTSALYVKDLKSGIERPVYERLDRDLQETDGSQGNTPAFGWTPDDKALVFWSGGKIRRVDVESKKSSVIKVRVKAERKVTAALRFPVDVAPDEVEVRMPRWAQISPDGSKIVFQALGHLYVRDAKGGAPSRLTSQSGQSEIHPSFSRDGKWIVYTTWSDDDLGQVKVVSVEGGPSRTVTKEPGHYIEPRFSPDGKWIVFRKATDGYLTTGSWSMDPGVYLISADGGDAKLLNKDGFNAQWGAASDRVFFSETVEDTQLHFKSMNLEGVDVRTHLKGEQATEYALSPDGRWIAFTENWNAYVAPFTLTGKTVEIGSGIKSIPVKQVSKRSGEWLHWSGDAKALHWAHGPTLYTRELKDAFAFMEGAPEKLPDPVETGIDLKFHVPADRPKGTIVLKGARIVTMRDAEKKQEIIERGIVVVAGNRIKEVGSVSAVEIPAGATVIDVSGKTIFPGLVDVHAHGALANEGIIPDQNWMQEANLAFGVTTIHDPSNDTASIFSAAELQRAGFMVAPRIFSTGTILYGAHDPGFTASIDSAEDAAFHVRRLKEVGAISVKSYQQPRRDQRQQIIAAARDQGMMVVPEGGAKFQANMSEIVDGHTGIEHATPLVEFYDDVKQFWSGTKVGYTPTFVVAYGGISGENYWYDHTDVWKDEHLMRFSPRFIIEPRSMRRVKAPEEHYNHIHVARTAHDLRLKGVSVQLGAHGQRAGLAAHWELWSMAQGGFTPWEAFRGATIDGARYIGMDRDIGSIEPGKLADLVVIGGDPLKEIRDSEKVAYTMINGRLYDAGTMDQVAPDKVKRKPLFFQKEGGDTIHPATWTWIESLSERLGWND
jgi:Tol biopolymer transport system component/imidazolonepropionase-like amidohydrolase